MEYEGPTSEDFDNISALNQLYLDRISLAETRSPAASGLQALTNTERARLAGVPFLLFSLREQDDAYWQHLFDDGRQRDLVELTEARDERVTALQVAGLSFLWQLVRRNPYAARIVSGAPVSWCEKLASLTLVGLLQRAALSGDLLRMRFPREDVIWSRLLGNGTSARRNLRRAAHHCALQRMLAGRAARHRPRAAAAACSMDTPRRRDGPGLGPGIRNSEV